MLGECRRANDALKDGLSEFVPGHRWFNSATAVEFVALCAKFNSLFPPTDEELFGTK